MAIGGINTKFKHGTHGALSTNTDFSPKIMNLNITIGQETVDATTFAANYKQYEASFQDAKFDVTYKYDDTVFGQLGEILTNQESVSFEFSPNGTTSGKPKISGSSMFISDWGMDLSSGELEEISITWQVTGAFPFGTHS